MAIKEAFEQRKPFSYQEGQGSEQYDKHANKAWNIEAAIHTIVDNRSRPDATRFQSDDSPAHSSYNGITQGSLEAEQEVRQAE